MKLMMIKKRILTLCILLLTVLCLLDMRAEQAALPAGGAYGKVEEEEKTVYLLVDVTSDSGYLKDILSELKEHRIKACFAVTGVWCRAFPEELLEIVKEKHAVISHSYAHPSYLEMARTDIQTDALKAIDQLDRDFDIVTGLLFPPYGLWDKEVEEALLEVGIQIVAPDLDAENFSGAEDQAREMLLKLKNHDILIFKASSPTAAGTIEKLIGELKSMGYCFADLRELFQE